MDWLNHIKVYKIVILKYMYDLLNLFIILHEYLSFENRFGYKSKHLRVSIAVVEELKANRHKQMLPLKQSCWWLSKLQRGQFSPRRTLENAFFFPTYKK